MNMTMTKDSSDLAGKTVRIKNDAPEIGGKEYRVEDWWHVVSGGSWMHANGNPACLHYAMRSGGHTPIDNKVLYGKIGGMGCLVHISEIESDS